MMMTQKRSLTFLVVVFVSDPIAIEVNAGDEIPRATNAFTAVFPPTLADRSKVRLDVASMMVMIVVVVELFGLNWERVDDCWWLGVALQRPLPALASMHSAAPLSTG